MKINEDFLIDSKINGSIYANNFKCKNLCDGIFESGNISDAGVETSSTTTYRSTNYYEVEGGETYICSYNSTSGTNLNWAACYNENKTFITRLTSLGKNPFKVPSNTKYVRLGFYKAAGISANDFSNVQLEYGSTITPYTPFTYINGNVDNALGDLKKSFGSYIRTTNIPNNLNAEYWAYELNYTIIGKVVFCNFIVNIKSRTSTSTDDVYFEMPFSFVSNWYFPIIKAADGNTSAEVYLQPQGGTNKIKVSKSIHRQYIKVSEVPSSGYFIDAQFFCFID